MFCYNQNPLVVILFLAAKRKRQKREESSDTESDNGKLWPVKMFSKLINRPKSIFRVSKQ